MMKMETDKISDESNTNSQVGNNLKIEAIP